MSETKNRGGEYAARGADRGRVGREMRRSQGCTKVDFARRRRNAGLALIAGILLILLAAWYLDGRDEIVRGVIVGEVEVGGMTRAEAREAV